MYYYTVRCFICGVYLGPLEFTDCIPNGVSFEFSVNYGSRYDGDYGRISFCDHCYGARVNRIHNYGNYVNEDTLKTND